MTADVGPDRNAGHGHVFKRPDRVRDRCMGPPNCSTCVNELARRDELAAAALVEALPVPDLRQAEHYARTISARLGELGWQIRPAERERAGPRDGSAELLDRLAEMERQRDTTT